RTLRDAGVTPGERIGVLTYGTIETAIAILGNAAFGAVTVPMNPKLGAKEVAHILADAAPRLLFAPDSEGATHEGLGVPVRCVGPDEPGARLSEVSCPVGDHPLLVLYTSGTTGAPKGAVITARNVAANLDGLA